MVAREAFQTGQHFHTRYAWKRRELQCWSQITMLDEGRLLELRHGNCSGSGIRIAIEVVEHITLEEKDGRTIVTKDVTVRNSGVPWFVIQLIWFIGRFVKPVGKDKLKEMCEGDTA
jgi:hypothetical protein